LARTQRLANVKSVRHGNLAGVNAFIKKGKPNGSSADERFSMRVSNVAIHLRQICLVADTLAPAIKDLSEVFSISACYVDPAVGKFGLENTLLSVGTKFIEVVAPIQANTAAGRFLRRRGGSGGYMVICQATSRAAQLEVRSRAADNGIRVAYESDRGTWNVMQLHPADLGASFLEVDWGEEADPGGNWHPAGGKNWQATVSSDVVSDILAVELQSHDPGVLAKRWAAVIGLPLQYPNRVPTISLGNADLRFVQILDGRGEGLGAIDLRVVDRARLLARAATRGVRLSDDQVLICGTRFNLLSGR
jgi:hypothetical protein